MLDKIKQIFKKESKPIPMSGGSLFNDINVLEAKTSITLDSMEKSLLNINNSITNYHNWQVLNFHANYFVNQFELENVEDQNLYNAILLCFKMYFYYGNAGIVFEAPNKYYAVYESESKINQYNQIQYIKCSYAIDFANPNIPLSANNNKELITLSGKQLDKYARLSGGENAFIKWWPFIQLQTELLTMINNHRFFMNKKMLINVNDVSNLQQETKAFFDINNPFIMNLDTDNINSNRFEASGFSGNNNSSDLLTYYNFVTKTYYELLGRKASFEDNKSSPSPMIKDKTSLTNFDILINSEFKNKEFFIKQINKFLNTNISIKKRQIEELTSQNVDGNLDKKPKKETK